MNKVNDISEELKSMDSFLADMSRKMPYTVPAGYFENFEASLQQTIKSLQETDPITDWGKTLPYHVPGDYFENLTAEIVAIASANGISEGISKELPFSVPMGYFESLPENILQAAKKSQPEKEILKPIIKTVHYFRPVRWAAAAVILICISLGSYITFYKDAPIANSEGILASVSNNEIQDYLQGTYRLDIDRVVGNNELANLQLDNKDIIQYLNETGWDALE